METPYLPINLGEAQSGTRYGDTANHRNADATDRQVAATCFLALVGAGLGVVGGVAGSRYPNKYTKIPSTVKRNEEQ